MTDHVIYRAATFKYNLPLHQGYLCPVKIGCMLFPVASTLKSKSMHLPDNLPQHMYHVMCSCPALKPSLISYAKTVALLPWSLCVHSIPSSLKDKMCTASSINVGYCTTVFSSTHTLPVCLPLFCTAIIL